jgi:hypothetical protein
LDRLHIRVHLWWVSRWTRQLLVVTGARCPLTKPVVAAVGLQETTEPHCSRGVQPGGIYVYVGTARADSRGPGVGLAPRPQALPMPAAALVLYIAPRPQALPMPAAALVPYIRLCWYIASWPPEVRGWACAKAASASYASCRSDSIYSTVYA